MMEDLYIKWETGYMNIHMDFFFPCSQQRFKKLLKVIALDWQHEDELKETLKVYFQNRISDLVELRKENGKKYFDFKQKAADTQRMIQSRKHPNGVSLSKEELKQARADLKDIQSAAKQALSDANSNLKFKNWFEKQLEFLKSL
jgi:post-segregation antitoxin (ccd killing protein)